ncbi:hypothetical protein [Phytohabitans houttuyneae]|uniref:DUF4190 domain-containing protein n=1 Tax=Phytohabitans houttuyneae TaxID=1076126 RepID=A0A6V8K8J7_9ACTN|nr:hypothetical protein [Phytohabitans houttuyneae]GFJ78618.1 hypothetical protein Phou_027980 [Phytohabitans houttuyneae]
MRIPSLTRRGEAQREDAARAEGRAEARAEDRIERKEDERTFSRDAGRNAVRERPAVVDETPTEKIKPVDRVETRREPEPVPEPVGPRPRSSLMATLALIVGVVAALATLTGVLAGYGIVAGGLAVLLAIAGVSATGRRHVAGRSEAMLALVLGLGAVVFGILVVTDSLSWITTASDKVGELRNWLDTQTVDRF